MVKNVMRKFNVLLKEHDWVQKWCVDVHNTASSRKLDWKSSLDVAVGHTQDITGFRFHMWEPIWYYKKYKAPEDPWKKAKWMGFAHNAGDAITYYIKTEESPFKYLIRSVICKRQRHVGAEREHVNEDSSLQPELREIESDFLNKNDEVILDDTTRKAEEK
eukprot:12139903-Ditylum_brightwellii.AAC.1